MSRASIGSGKHIVVFVTVSSPDEAKRICDVLLEKRVVACANVLRDVQSFYWWKGKLDQSKELLLLMKSRRELLDEIVRLVKENHSYEVPEIVAVPMVGGSADYLRWIEESVEIHHKE